MLFSHDDPHEPPSSDMDVAKPASFIISSTWLGVHGQFVWWLGLPRSRHSCAARAFQELVSSVDLVDGTCWLPPPLLWHVWAIFLLGVAAESVDVSGPSHWSFFGGDIRLRLGSLGTREAGEHRLGSACRGLAGDSADTHVQGGFLQLGYSLFISGN